MVVVNIRGTSGSGKTYAVRRVMGHYGTSEPITRDVDGRSRVVGQLLTRDGGRQLMLAGRYDGPTCGGCDGLSWKGAPDFITDLVVGYAERGDVILEGLLVSTWGWERIRALSRAVEPLGGFLALQLTTSLEDCLAAIQSRRDARGNTKPLDPSNTASKWKGIRNGGRKLKEVGVRVEEVDRDGAYLKMKEVLGL